MKDWRRVEKSQSCNHRKIGMLCSLLHRVPKELGVTAYYIILHNLNVF
jgi:hypothetical protein